MFVKWIRKPKPNSLLTLVLRQRHTLRRCNVEVRLLFMSYVRLSFGSISFRTLNKVPRIVSCRFADENLKAALLTELRTYSRQFFSQNPHTWNANSFGVSSGTLCHGGGACDSAVCTTVTQTQTWLQGNEKKGRKGSHRIGQRRRRTVFRQSEEKWPQCSYSISVGLVHSFAVKCITIDWNRSRGCVQYSIHRARGLNLSTAIWCVLPLPLIWRRITLNL